MRYRALDQNGDYSFGQGSQNFLVNSNQAVAQAIRTALALFEGEWFLDTTAGVPWLQSVVGYGTQGIYDSIIKQAVLGVEGVVSIVNYTSVLNRGTRALTVNMTVQTQFGAAQVQTSVNPPLTGFGVGAFGSQPFGV